MNQPEPASFFYLSLMNSLEPALNRLEPGFDLPTLKTHAIKQTTGTTGRHCGGSTCEPRSSSPTQWSVLCRSSWVTKRTVPFRSGRRRAVTGTGRQRGGRRLFIVPFFFKVVFDYSLGISDGVFWNQLEPTLNVLELNNFRPDPRNVFSM